MSIYFLDIVTFVQYVVFSVDFLDSESEIDVGGDDEGDVEKEEKKTNTKPQVTRTYRSEASSSSIPTSQRSETSIAVRVNFPACDLCETRGHTCISSDGQSKRCDKCKKSKQKCSFSDKSQNAKRSGTYASPCYIFSRTLKLSGHYITVPDTDSDVEEISESPPKKKGRTSNVVSISTAGQSAPGQKYVEVSMPQPTPRNQVPVQASTTTKFVEDQTSNTEGMEALSNAREGFFRALDSCKANLGGSQSEAFRQLYVSAKMWQAQEDLLLSN